MTVELKLIDHALLSPDATTKQIEDLCAETKRYDFCSAYIGLCQVETATHCLRGSDMKVCTVIGFLSGAHVTSIESAETEQVVTGGAQEVDMVINVEAVKEDNRGYVENDVAVVVEVAGKEVLMEVILETCLLADEEIVEACKCAQAAGTDSIKTSTGFSKAGATAEAVALMHKTVDDIIGIKTAGGIRASGTFKAMVAAGTNRIRASTRIKLIGGAQ